LDWQIAGPIIGIAVPVVLFLWTRREKVRIKITGIDYRVHGVKKELKVYLGSELHRSGHKEIRYINQVCLKPERQRYSELCHYFNLSDDGLVKFNGRIKLPRDTIVRWPTDDPSYKALSEIETTDERDKAQQIASKLSQKVHRIGLVWEDTGKTTWKTISKGKYGKWV